MTLSLIAALGKNGIIGQTGGKLGLPWHLPEDLKHFRKLTLGKPLLMGRTTWELIGKALPDRRCLALSRQSWSMPGVETVPTLEAALELCKDDPEVMVGGGAQIYAQTLPLAHRMYLTEVDISAAGDVSFPLFDRRDWRQIDRHHYTGSPGYTFVVYEKVS